MSDQEASPPEPPAAEAPRQYLPFAAYLSPTGTAPAPPAPTWTKAYEHPTARRVVSTGLQLAVEANREIRRASIYIGLLALGAFGPAVLLLLLGIARLLSDPSIAATLADDPTAVFIDQPELLGPLALIYFLLIVGGLLLIAISIDAQAMAIAILGGRAADRPLRLWEAIVRARQVFWRLFVAGLIVGLVSGVVSLAITIPFFRPFDTNTGLTFIASMIAALVVTPFAFASAGIVLGDVAAAEALRRSIALFRARPRISVVVTLFTLVTSAIQTFAISAGADAAVRVGEILHLGLDQGVLPMVVTLVIVLAFIVAFGSLTFTIAAIVAAPQVTGFLGLTYYSGGIDKARTADGKRPRRFRWVSVPMAITMAGILVVAGLGLPSITGFQARASGPLLTFLRQVAQEHASFVRTFGSGAGAEDSGADQVGDAIDWIDVIQAEYAFLPDVPPWLIDAVFDCNLANVACSTPESREQFGAYGDGAYVFLQRMASPPGIVPDYGYGEWGPLLAVAGHDTAPMTKDQPYLGASHAIITFVSGGTRSVRYLRYEFGTFSQSRLNVRSIWIGNDLITIVPRIGGIDADPTWWDVAASLTLNGKAVSRDSIGATGVQPGLEQPFDLPPDYWIVPLDEPFAS